MLLNKPKNFAPLKPKEDLSKTAKGKPNFCDGFPIKFDKKYVQISLWNSDRCWTYRKW